MAKSKKAPTSDLAPAPLQQQLPGKLGPISRNHKRRSNWFQTRAAWPLREAQVRRLVSERERVDDTLLAAPGTEQWENIGPTNVGGRVTSLVCDPAQPDHLWAGAAGGGVWESTDAGKTWKGLWDLQSVLNIGALAIHPTNPEILYCGTGEANLSADSYAGVGLYRTTNGGRTWQLFASCQKTKIPTRIGVIAIDPLDPRHMRLGGIGFGRVSPGEEGLGGMYTSRDAGKTWGREEFITSQNYWCHSIVFHPTKPERIFATVTAQGMRNGLWRTLDGGETWKQLTQGLPTPAEFDRATIALAPSKPDVLYLQAASKAEDVLGVFRSDDGGDSWKDISGTHFGDEEQMTYGNAIVVHPGDPDHVLCGGIDLHRTTDGGRTWQKVSRWYLKPGKNKYAHSDHHALLMPAAAPGRVYDGNDGGVDVSEDGGQRWENRSKGLAITMYYDLDAAPSDARSFGGGTQDNGTVVTKTGGADDHFEKRGGRWRLDGLPPEGCQSRLRILLQYEHHADARPPPARCFAARPRRGERKSVDGFYRPRSQQTIDGLYRLNASLAFARRWRVVAGRFETSGPQPHHRYRSRAGRLKTNLCRHGKRRLLSQHRWRQDLEPKYGGPGTAVGYHHAA